MFQNFIIFFSFILTRTVRTSAMWSIRPLNPHPKKKVGWCDPKVGWCDAKVLGKSDAPRGVVAVTSAISVQPWAHLG